MKSKVIKPDSKDQEQTLLATSIFLAGSIEMGKAEDWQSRIEKELENERVNIFNPRRDDWNSDWIQRETNPEFNNQVNWELDKLTDCSIIFMYFAPNTQSPISLLELGAFAASGKMIVCCPTNFWRRGNVEIVCSRNGVPIYDDLDAAIGALKSRIRKYNTVWG